MGCYLYLLSILFVSFNHIVGNQNQVIFAVKCGGVVWCGSIALSLIFGTICIKTWRIRHIFSRSSSLIRMRSRSNISRKKKCNPFATHSLVLYVCAIVLLDIAFQVSWSVIDPWYMKTLRVERNIHLTCGCDHLNVWVSLLIGQKTVLTIVVSLQPGTCTRKNTSRQSQQMLWSTSTSSSMACYLHWLYCC